MTVNRISIYDINLNRIGILYTWVSMLWNEGYNTLGQFELELLRTDEVMELVQKDHYCGINDSDTLMLIESIDVQDNVVVANGFPATVILSHRVSETVISNQVAETAMRNLVSAMDPWERVELGPSAGLTTRFTPETSDQSLEEYCEEIAQECDLGFKMVHDKENKKLLFTVYQPEKNVNAKYSSKFGNVNGAEYIISDAEYKNVARVAGEGQDEERISVWAGATSSTGYERREIYIDARSERMEEDESLSDYRARLVAYGEDKLIDYIEAETISFNVTDEVELGQVVIANLQEIGIKLEARVAEVTIQSQDNGTTREITVGTPFNIVRR